MSTIWLEGVDSNSRLIPQEPHWTIALPAPCGSFTRIDSSPHEGQVKTVGSFFLMTLTTRLRRRPNMDSSFQPVLNWRVISRLHAPKPILKTLTGNSLSEYETVSMTDSVVRSSGRQGSKGDY